MEEGEYVRLLVTLEVLVAAEGLVAARVVALAHGAADNVHRTRVGLGGTGSGPLAGGTHLLGTLELARLALGLVQHHAAVGPGGAVVAVGRVVEGGDGVAVEVEGLDVAERHVAREELDGALVGDGPRRGGVGHLGPGQALGGRHHVRRGAHGGLGVDGVRRVAGRHGAQLAVEVEQVILGGEAVHALHGRRR